MAVILLSDITLIDVHLYAHVAIPIAGTSATSEAGGPTQTFGVGVSCELLLQRVQWERTQLLHPNYSSVLFGCWCLPLLQEGVVMLPRAQHHLLDAAGSNRNMGLLCGSYFWKVFLSLIDIWSHLNEIFKLIKYISPQWRHTTEEVCTFLQGLKCHPALVWSMFLGPVQSDWTLHPEKNNTHTVEPHA